tara:strand:- start:1930 stop:2460 length:531 start_codon:yes stop_codon:yes gene_type:complete
MINIDAFKAYVSSKGGFARTNMWQVVLPQLAGFNILTQELNVLCKDVVLPGRQIVTNERIVGMKPTKQAYAFLQDDVSLTFHLLNDYRIKEYFDNWTSQIINDDDAFSLNYPNEYSGDVLIQQIKAGGGEADDEVIYTCILENAFPTTVNAINLNNEQNGIVELNVQLSYRNWSTR